VQYLQNVGDIAPFELGVCCLKSKQEQALIKAFFQTIISV
jgi:LysR family transcriptional regulator, positive regulator for ilvC